MPNLEQNTNQENNEDISNIVPVKLFHAGRTLDERHSDQQKYPPSLEENGEVEGMADTYGLGVFKQNGKYYLSTCNIGSPEAAFLIPENVANQIVEHIESGCENPTVDKLVESLWSRDLADKGKDILEKIAKEIS